MVAAAVEEVRAHILERLVEANECEGTDLIELDYQFKYVHASTFRCI